LDAPSLPASKDLLLNSCSGAEGAAGAGAAGGEARRLHEDTGRAAAVADVAEAAGRVELDTMTAPTRQVRVAIFSAPQPMLDDVVGVEDS
jgi:hypothetical protein